MVQYEGAQVEGKVLDVNQEDKQICLLTNEQQEFWYSLNDLHAIPLDEAQLLKLKFRKDEELSGNGAQVYSRGPFSVKLYKQDNDDWIRLDYRDEHRDLKGPLTVNVLQNHYHGMTNFHLD